MSLTQRELINVIDDLGEVRDLVTVAMLASEGIAERETSSGFSRLLGMVLVKLNTVNETLDAVRVESNHAA